MSGHICFESIDCKKLVYVRESDSWVCMDLFMDLDDCDFCMRCKMLEKRRNEKAMLEVIESGRVLRLAQDSLV